MSILKTFAIIYLLLNTIDSKQISQCANGQATYYGIDANGSCGFGDIVFTMPTAAAPLDLYDGSRMCGVCYEVIGEKGKKTFMIADSCPGCALAKNTGRIHLDLDETHFPDIDEMWKGNIKTSMRMVSCKVKGNVKLVITETNNWYFNAYVYNSKIGIKNLQIKLDPGNFIDVPRKNHNRFIMNLSGNFKQITIKVIGFSGEEIICYKNKDVIQGTYDCGKQFRDTGKFFDIFSGEEMPPDKKPKCCKKQSSISSVSQCNVKV